MARKQLVMETDQAFLTRDIIINILIRLPVKSLIRFQCVCKDWKNLINTPSFIQDHLHQSSHQNPSLLLKWEYAAGSFQMQVGFLDRDMQVREVQKSPSTDRFFPWIVGSSNGLLCVEEVTHHSLLLWNPAIREVRRVRLRTNLDDDPILDYFGFGFSPIDNDYKIVRIKFPEYRFQMEVYSLNSGSWKEVKVGNLEGMRVHGPRNVTVNGVVFWIGGKQGGGDYDHILSYDLSKEVCRVISMPKLNSDDLKDLIVYENKIAVVSCVEGEDKSYSIHLWVMEENCEEWRWTKIYTSGPGPCKLRPVTIWKNEIALLPFDTENDGQTPILYLLNLTTNEFRKLAVRCNSYIRKKIQLFNYVEGLVSVGNVNVGKL